METDHTKMKTASPDCRKLNLGSGEMLKKDYINFDMIRTTRNGMTTDCIGDLEQLEFQFEHGQYEEILCFHVIEHFTLTKAKKLLKDCFNLLKDDGILIMEGPDIHGIIELYNEKHPIMDTPAKVIQQIYGSPTHIDDSTEQQHLWGWTRGLMRNAMMDAGFFIKHVGIGQSHGMGKRDYRVEGVRK